jgi:hypothetical protein
VPMANVAGGAGCLREAVYTTAPGVNQQSYSPCG